MIAIVSATIQLPLYGLNYASGVKGNFPVPEYVKGRRWQAFLTGAVVIPNWILKLLSKWRLGYPVSCRQSPLAVDPEIMVSSEELELILLTGRTLSAPPSAFAGLQTDLPLH